MALKRIFPDDIDLEKLLKAEAYSTFPDNEHEQKAYIEIAQLYPLPPKGCPLERYIKARSYAASIWDKWNPRSSKDLLMKSFLKASIIFEIANYLISANIEEAPIVGHQTKNSSGKEYFIRTLTPRKLLHRNLTKEIKSAKTLITSDFITEELRTSIDSHLKKLNFQMDLLKSNSVFTFQESEFKTIKLSKKSRIHDYLLSTLITHCVEIFVRCLEDEPNEKFNQTNAINEIQKFTNRFIDPTTNIKSYLTADAIRERYKIRKKDKPYINDFDFKFYEIAKNIIKLNI